MADISWGEAVGGGVVGIISGIVGTIKALGDRRNGEDRRNGNGHGNGHTKDLHAMDKRVLVVELGLEGIQKDIGEIKGDVAAIRDAVMGGKN